MNNEPVAWMSIREGVYSPSFEYLFSRTKKEGFIPLYTHPVKELTDEEILEELFIPKSEWNSYKAHHCLKQIRAILRKAQEQ